MWNLEEHLQGLTKQCMIATEDYSKYADDYRGFCKECKQVTNRNCSPNAEDHKCDVCGKNAVVGIVNALMMNLIYLLE